MTIRALPTTPDPAPGDDTPDLKAILLEVKGGLKDHESKLRDARELQDWYDGNSEKYVPAKPSEDSLTWATKPKRVSNITSHAIERLTSFLYRPGPRTRKVGSDEEVSAWYGRVCQDIQLSAVMHEADQLATLHGMAMIGIYATGHYYRPIHFHLYPRQDFVFWASPDDPRVATAVCTITCTGPDVTRYRLWTATHHYDFFKGKTWGYQPGGWGAARFVPEASGAHPYGVLPFCFVTHKLPTTELETRGLGYKLAKVNKELNADRSNLALWVHHYSRPIGYASGVGPEWRPKIVTGGFVPLVARQDSTESAPVMPEMKYLESAFDIKAVSDWIVSNANMSLAELGVPLTIASDTGSGDARNGMSGLAIAAMDADLITYARGRQPLFETHESRLCSLICKVAASEAGNMGAFAANLEAVAADPSLRIGWPEVQIDLPGQARDQSDQWELDNLISDPIEILMHRRNLTESEAIEQYRSTCRRRAIAETLQTDPEAVVDDPNADPTEGEEVQDVEDDAEDSITPDMGVESPEVTTADLGVQPSMVAVDVYNASTPLPIGPGTGMPGVARTTES